MSIDMAASIVSTRRKNKLDWYEKEIEKRWKSFAQIFKELRDDPEKPFLVSHDDFYSYAQDRWGIAERRMQQLIKSDTVRLQLTEEAPELATVVDRMPEGQMRELATAPAEKRAEVLRDAVKQPGKMTANKIKQAKARVIEPALPRKYPAQTTSLDPTPSPEVLPPTSNVCPHCHGTGRIE